MVETASGEMIPVVVGLLSMSIGIGLMVWHWTQWSALVKSSPSPREYRYGANQFRRRVWIGSLMAITGAILTSLTWASDFRMITASILMLLVLLSCILVLAVLDLLSVIVHWRLGPASRAARQRLIEEYQRRQREKENPSTDSPHGE